MLYDKKDVAGIGRFYVNIKGLKEKNIVIPSLHFIVFKTQTGFECFCLEFQLSSFSSNDELSISQLSTQISEYIRELFSQPVEDAIQQIYDRIDDNINDYWSIYRNMTFKLGFSGIETDSNKVLIKEIEALKKRIAILEAIKDLEYKQNTTKLIIETSNEYNELSA